ncbi:LCP family glycopolymer transferase [Enterococcus sp. AZ109]|uniref:LCP family glycopolymer transferase n=1 Tax=Enterococcus sp. AZ109 TaxID=2774634 RepID=UPI003F20E853
MKKDGKRKERSPLKIVLIGLSIALLAVILGLIVFCYRVFSDVKATTGNMYQSVERENGIKKASLDELEPFSVLLLGVDTGALGRTEQGRSDTLIVAVVNPKEEQTTLVSVPRDTYTEIVGYGEMDKINHAYAFGGVSMSIATVEKLLDIPINYYATINMEGIEQLVDAVGGIWVDNQFSFTYDETEFPVGRQQLGGVQALQYVRMRYDDPDGDYGRQSRQRQLIKGLAKQGLSLDGLASYQEILSSLEQNMSTDITFDEVGVLVRKYRTTLGNIKLEQVHGEEYMQDNISYQQVPPEELARIQTLVKSQLN